MRRLGLCLVLLVFVLVLVLASCGPPAGTSGPLPTEMSSSTALTEATEPGINPTTTAMEQAADLTIAVGESTGRTIKPLLGVNVGPIPAGNDPHNADLTTAYQQIGVTLIRTHDFYGPLDMATMYPDRRRDPADPRSYDFRASDATWHAIVEGGFEPYLRLGDSYNNVRPPANAQERANWARAGVEVVRHYRQGQGNGSGTPFRYVEIWNEPDNQHFWPKPRTRVEYFQLYVETAVALKQAFPDLQIGGPGLTQAGFSRPQGQGWLRDFLVHVRENKAPLDFFSWHLYANDPNEWVAAAQSYRGQLDALGFPATTMHVTEWNTDIRQLGDTSAEALALRTGGKGASILTAAWIAMQGQDVDVSTFYRGSDPSMDAVEFYGLFYADGNPKRVALAFSLWAQLVAHPQQLEVATAPETRLWILAGEDDSGEVALLVANPTDTPARYAVTGVEGARLVLRQVNDASDRVRSLTVDGRVAEIGAYTVQLVTVAK